MSDWVTDGDAPDRNPTTGTFFACCASAEKPRAKSKAHTATLISFPLPLSSCLMLVLPNHLVSTRQHVRRNRKTDLFGGLEINNKLELRGLLHRKVSRLSAFQNLVDQSGGVSAIGTGARPIRHKTTAVHKISPSIYRRQPIISRKVGDSFLTGNSCRAQRHGESGAPRLSRRFERTLVFVGATYLHRINLQTQFSCRELAFFPLWYRAGRLWIPQHRNARELWHGFLEQLQSFARQNRRNVGQSRDVSPRPRQAVNQLRLDRIRHAHKNDGNRSGRVLAS